MAARDIHFIVASGNSMSRLKPMFAETFDRLHFVAENGGQVVSLWQASVSGVYGQMMLKTC